MMLHLWNTTKLWVQRVVSSSINKIPEAISVDERTRDNNLYRLALQQEEGRT